VIPQRLRFEAWLAIAFVAIAALVWAWQHAGALRGPLTRAEIDRYLAAIDAQLPWPGEERAASLQRLRSWAEADDGRPVYMLNLMRYYRELHRFAGAPDFDGTPREANARYEAATIPLLLKVGGTGQFMGTPQGRNVLDSPAAGDDWSRVLLVRYPSRRSFLELIADPRYAPTAPLKLMASQVYLVPLRADLVLPDVSSAVSAGLLVIYLAIGWRRAVMRREFP
jgi:hypothetical protein